MTALEAGGYAQALRRFGERSSPRALIVISAHWETHQRVGIVAGSHPGLIYDFGGFPPELYQLTYPAPGDPALARTLQRQLNEQGWKAELDEHRGWDHGLWVPLRLMFPLAAIPVVQMSLPDAASPEQVLRLGQSLSTVREQDVLVIASGGLVHNLRRMIFGAIDAPVADWARQFQAWVLEKLHARDIDSLLHYAKLAPQAALAVPTPEHFAPLFAALGAAGAYEKLELVTDEIQYGSMSMVSFALH